MRAGFEYFRVFPINAEQNKEYAKTKLEMPILAMGGSASLGNITAISMQKVANNVTGEVIPLTSHFIAEEQPDFVIEKLVNFFGGSNTTNATE
jgi:pimeloyl-ACP methyl ester carboxylesterase